MKQGTATERYDRQRRLAVLGDEGQERLRASTALVVGCGGLGGLASELLVRAGVGRVRVVDPDLVDLPNLHRQILFEEADLGRPKAQVAGERLARLNVEVAVEAVVERLDAQSALCLLEGVQVVIDGTDNLESRYLLNDACLELGLPWIYGGAVGTSGMTVTLGLPGGPCLRCLFPEPPPDSLRASCATVGILNSLPALVSSLQVSQALRVLLDAAAPVELLTCDAWDASFSRLPVSRAADCPACALGRRDFLRGDERGAVTR